MLAPIVLFVYNRPEHTKAILDSLNECRLIERSKLIIFADAAKNSSEVHKVNSVKSIIESKKLRCNTEIVYQDSNFGLRKSITSGVSQVLDIYEKIIVLEDDLILHKDFLDFLNEALFEFKNNEKVYQISGFQFDVSFFKRYKYVSMPNISTWGWGTWKRAWKLSDDLALSRMLQNIKSNKILARKYNMGGFYDYTKLLGKEVEGDLNSWGIRFYNEVFKNEGKVIYPGESLVGNNGFGSGTNTTGGKLFSIQLKNEGSIQKRLILENHLIVNTLLKYMVKKDL